MVKFGEAPHWPRDGLRLFINWSCLWMFLGYFSSHNPSYTDPLDAMVAAARYKKIISI